MAQNIDCRGSINPISFMILLSTPVFAFAMAFHASRGPNPVGPVGLLGFDVGFPILFALFSAILSIGMMVFLSSHDP
jgi:hypothetical protein